MIVKLIAPGILPGDHVTVDLQDVPRKGETVVVYNRATHIEESLTVHQVVWAITPVPSILHHATADLVEIICDRTEDVGELFRCKSPTCACQDDTRYAQPAERN